MTSWEAAPGSGVLPPVVTAETCGLQIVLGGFVQAVPVTQVEPVRPI